MNSTEQKDHHMVTSELRGHLHTHLEESATNFELVADRLDLHQRELDLVSSQIGDLREDLNRLEVDLLAFVRAEVQAQTQPLTRAVWGRVKWFVCGR